MKYEDIRRQVLTAIRQASAQGLIHGTSGNISVRDREAGVAAITPSGRPYDTMEPGDIAIVTLEGEWVDGPYAPSSETPKMCIRDRRHRGLRGLHLCGADVLPGPGSRPHR